MSRTYTREQIDSFKGGHREAAEKIDAIEAKREAEQAQKQDEQTKVEVTALPTKAEKFEATVFEQKKEEVVVETPKVEEKKPQYETKDLEYYKKKAEESEKRRRDQEPAVTKAQTKAAELEKENKNLSKKLEELSSKFDTLLSKLNGDVRKAEDDELSNTYGEELASGVDKRIAKHSQTLEERIKAIEASQQKEREESEKRSVQDKLNAHFADIKGVHKDAWDFMNPQNSTVRPAFMAWVEENEPDEIFDILSNNPLAISGKSIAKFITKFKNDTTFVKRSEEPSLADIVVKSNASAPEYRETNIKSEYLTDDEMTNFNRLLQSASRKKDKAEMERLVSGWEKTQLRKRK